MEFRQLEAFAAVADMKSFSLAADALFLSQSTVSTHIKNLEKELQKNLIIRTTKSLQLTSDGILFLEYAKRIIETRDAAIESLNAPSDLTIHLGASTIPSSYLLPPLLSSFRTTHPSVLFNITQSDSSEILSKILDGSIELGIIGEDASSPKCACIPFCSDELVLVTPATPYYQDLKKSEPDLCDLLLEPMLLREQGSGTQKAANRFLDALNIREEDLHVVAKTNNPESIKRMIVNGMGVALLSGLASKDLEEHGLVISYPLPPQFSRKFYIAYLKSRTLSSSLQDFIRHVLHFYTPAQ